MNHEEVFVSALSIILGLVGITAAVSNWDGYYRISKMRWIETVGGRWCARLFYGLIGGALIALGIAIAIGFGPNKSSALMRLHQRSRHTIDVNPRGELATGYRCNVEFGRMAC